MGLGRNKEAALRNEGCNSRLALYYQSPHQHARAQKSSFPTSLGIGTSREWGGHGDSLCGEPWSNRLAEGLRAVQGHPLSSPVAYSH